MLRRLYFCRREEVITDLNVLMVEPGKTPYETDIAPGLESLQKTVGGYIQEVYPFDDPVAIVCNEEGKLMHLPANRALYDENGCMYDILVGKFLVVGLGEESYADLSPDLMEKYKRHFKDPERFMKIAGQIVAVKCSVEREHKPHSVKLSVPEPGR